MMFGRQLHCLLSNIRPNKRKHQHYQQVKENVRTTSPNYHPGENVFIKTRDEKKWQPATIVSRKHRYSYLVSTPR
ncbi:hypothetical protein K1T71_003229 [Dendrolimus kikuchii]|uniref:Uncharacterized protein n=1 Tax=Dendrolimus kikuchii TaxID=765133 RepID=A0ACC1DAZ2_9NEOP|nr:hypothetical protein K1T71_003229 [Dendrolimus kikuchii]